MVDTMVGRSKALYKMYLVEEYEMVVRSIPQRRPIPRRRRRQRRERVRGDQARETRYEEGCLVGDDFAWRRRVGD
jgi:hypothetical protein